VIERTPYGQRFPARRHQVIDEDEIAGKRIFIIGDIHGCYDELVELLEETNARDPQMCVLFVGDLMNKGPKSAQVVKLVREMGAYCVRGNHEEVSLLEWQKFNTDSATMKEKFSWLHELSADDINWVMELPFSVRIPSRKIVVVHAGMVPGIDIEDQNPDLLLHMRDVVYDTETQRWRGIKKPQLDSVPWASEWPGPDHVYFGHDARRKFQSYKYTTGLDTGCVYGGTLTGIFPGEGTGECSGGRVVSIKAHRAYEQPKQKNSNKNNTNAK
jgi:predicted phosphodiesterase